jgi:hypothetical protein
MTSKAQRDIIEEFMEVFPRAYTVEDTMRLCLRLKEECDSLKNELSIHRLSKAKLLKWWRLW